MRFSTPASRPFCDLEILRPSFFFFNHFSRIILVHHHHLSAFVQFYLCFVQSHHHDVIKGFSLRCPILLRKTKFLHYFSHFQDFRSQDHWCLSNDVHILRVSVTYLSSIFLGSLCPLTLKKRRSLTIFNNPGEGCFISLRLSSAGVYIACVYRTLSLKWATGASPLRCLLACFDPWWVGEPPESFFL